MLRFGDYVDQSDARTAKSRIALGVSARSALGTSAFERRSRGPLRAAHFDLRSHGEWTAAGRGAETVPLAPEYTARTCNTSLSKKIADITGGKVYDDTDEALRDVAVQKTAFRPFDRPVQARLPLWYWLVFAAAFVLLADVGKRRVAIDGHKVKVWCVRAWLRLRGEVVPEPEHEPIADRLQSRRPTDQGQAARRFEAGPQSTGPLPTAADAAAPAADKPARPTTSQPAKPTENRRTR